MKKFLKVFPFLLVFVCVFALQVKLDVDNRHRPFLEPFGRESQAGTTTANRQPQVLGDHTYAWLQSPNIIIATLDPAGQQIKKEERPAPADDLFASTLFRLEGDDLFWVGNKRVLKHATWKGGKWTQTEEIGKDANSVHTLPFGEATLLLTGSGNQLKLSKLAGGILQEVKSFTANKVVQIAAQTDAKGTIHVSAVNQIASDTYDLLYLTIDGKTGAATEPKKLQSLHLDSSSIIDDMTFGIDKTHGYSIMTYKSGRSNNKDLRVYSFPLDNPAAGKLSRLSDAGAPDTSYTAYAAPGQGDSLKFVFVAEWSKNPRIEGRELFLSTLQNGQWKGDMQRLTNTLKVAVNPVFDQKGDVTTVLFAVLSGYDEYEMYYTSDDPAYAAATNVLVKDDYVKSAMQVPQYLGMAMILLVMVMAWPVLSYVYLLYLVLKKEDQLYDRPTVHLFVAILLNLATQAWVFLSYGKFENIQLYAPEWMSSPGGFMLLLAILSLVTYAFTWMFGKIRYERYALAEFNYFFGLNVWLVILGLSYYMAP
jgi:hypothetical protein